MSASCASEIPGLVAARRAEFHGAFHGLKTGVCVLHDVHGSRNILFGVYVARRSVHGRWELSMSFRGKMSQYCNAVTGSFVREIYTGGAVVAMLLCRITSVTQLTNWPFTGRATVDFEIRANDPSMGAFWYRWCNLLRFRNGFSHAIWRRFVQALESSFLRIIEKTSQNQCVAICPTPRAKCLVQTTAQFTQTIERYHDSRSRILKKWGSLHHWSLKLSADDIWRGRESKRCIFSTSYTNVWFAV